MKPAWNVCTACQFLTTPDAEQCNYCYSPRPPSGWPAFRSERDPWLGETFADDRFLVAGIRDRSRDAHRYIMYDLHGGDRAVMKVPTADHIVALSQVEHERAILTALAPLGGPRILDVLREEDRASIVIEETGEMTLTESIFVDGPFLAPAAIRIIRQLAEFIAAMHAAEVFHGAISADNVYLTGMLSDATPPKLVNFMSAFAPGVTPDYPPPVNAAYAAPERREGMYPTAASDVYSLGILAYHIWGNIEPERASRSLGNGCFYGVWQRDAFCAPCAVRFIELLKRMVHTDPMYRPSAQVVAAELLDLERVMLRAGRPHRSEQVVGELTHREYDFTGGPQWKDPYTKLERHYLYEMPNGASPGNATQMRQRGRTAVVATDNGLVGLFRRREPTIRTLMLDDRRTPVNAIEVCHGDFVFAGMDDGRLMVGKVTEHGWFAVETGASIIGMDSSTDGTMVAVVRADGRISCFDLSEGKPVEISHRVFLGATSCAVRDMSGVEVWFDEAPPLAWDPESGDVKPA